MTEPTFPDAEMSFRDFLRAQTSILAALEARGGSSDDIDLDPSKALPCVVVYRAGGRPDPYVPVTKAAIGLDVWGTATGSRLSAMEILKPLLGVLWSIKAQTVLVPGVVAMSWTTESASWFPDPSGRPRYTILGVLQYRSSALAA